MRVFPVVLPSGERYWTVLDEQLVVVEVADAFLRRFLGTDRLGFEVKNSGPESLAGDFSRFRFLLGATDGEGLFTPDEQ